MAATNQSKMARTNKLVSEDDAAIAARIRYEMGKMSAYELAAKIGSTRPTVQNYLNCRNRVPAPVLARIARALGVSSDRLLGINPEENRPASRGDLNAIREQLIAIEKQLGRGN